MDSHTLASFFFFSQDDHISWRSGLYLCNLRHVLCAGQLCPFPDWGTCQQSQTSSVCQRCQTDTLLAGELCLGYGEYNPWFITNIVWRMDLASLSDLLLVLVILSWTTLSQPPWWCWSSSVSSSSRMFRRPTFPLLSCCCSSMGKPGNVEAVLMFVP